MTQIRLHFTAPRGQAGELYAVLERALEDDGYPLSIFEREDDTATDEISIYVEDGADEVADRVRALLADRTSAVHIEQETLPDIDWVSHTLEGLKPVRAGRFLVHGAHDRDKKRPGDLAIEIEAGMAFGTGHHGTTAGCLELVSTVARKECPRNALDLGTGSGVLAIGLALLLPIPVLATDIDPVAVEVTRANARLNRVASRVEAAQADGFHNRAFARHGPFDLIVANILARPLMGLAPHIARHVVPGGSVILSGILERQRNAVLAAYVGQGFRHIRTRHLDGWVTMHLKR